MNRSKGNYVLILDTEGIDSRERDTMISRNYLQNKLKELLIEI